MFSALPLEKTTEKIGGTFPFHYSAEQQERSATKSTSTISANGAKVSVFKGAQSKATSVLASKRRINIQNYVQKQLEHDTSSPSRACYHHQKWKKVSLVLHRGIKSTSSIPPVTYLQHSTTSEQLLSMIPDRCSFPRWSRCTLIKTFPKMLPGRS